MLRFLFVFAQALYVVVEVAAGGSVTAPFAIDDYTRWRLLEGVDGLGLTLRHEADITAFEATQQAFKPTTLPART